MHGFAGFTQIYLSLARPAVYDCNDFWQYSSIATITPNFLRSLDFNVHSTVYDEIPKVIRRKLERDGWVVIFYSVSRLTRKICVIHNKIIAGSLSNDYGFRVGVGKDAGL